MKPWTGLLKSRVFLIKDQADAVVIRRDLFGQPHLLLNLEGFLLNDLHHCDCSKNLRPSLSDKTTRGVIGSF
jgi:hypothetical protein